MRVWAIAKKEIIQILRDPLSLGIAFLIPVILLFLFGYAITFDIKNIPTVVYDMDKSRLSRELISGFDKSRYFSIIDYINDEDQINEYLDSNKAWLAITVPYDFTKKIKTGRDAHFQVILDGSDANTANVAQGYVLGVTDLFMNNLAKVKVKPLIDVRQRVWFNPELKSRNFIVPGLIAVIMAIIAALLTSLTVSREWERGTMEQLISTPVRNYEIILGKLIPYFLIGFIDMCIALFVGIIIFGVTFKGSLMLIILASSVFLFGGLSWGIFISILTRSQLLSSQMSMVSTFLPALLLSGFAFSISNMPKPIQLVTYIIPARYFVYILKSVFLKGSTLNFIIIELLLLALYGAVVFIIANKSFKRIVA
ncbi:MAG: ABC transporter permease [Armatimonadota bacterium]